jgi:hypothetical protein
MLSTTTKQHEATMTPLSVFLGNNVADPDPNPVGSGPFWLDPDPDVWDRIRIRFRIWILALINESISTFLVWVKAKNTSGIYVF